MASTSNTPPTTASSTASGLEDDLLTLYRNQLRSDSRDQPSVVMHPKLRRPARCRNCRHIEDLESAPIAMRNTGEGEHAVHLPEPDIEHPPPEAVTPAAPHRLSLLQGNSCFRCVKEMYEKTGSLQELPPAGSGGDTPFHHAARCGNLRMLYHLITLLREGGVHHDRAVKAVAMRNDNEETALHIAVSVGNVEIVELLLWVHPQLCRLTCFNISPIYLAVSLGRRGIAKALHGASSTGISYSGPNRQNALHSAAFDNNGDMAQMLLIWNKGLAKEKDDNGRTPLHFAVSLPQRRYIYICCFRLTWRWRECGSVRQLLEANSSMAYEKDNEGLFPIHVAAMTYEWYSIDILVKRCPGCMYLRDNKGRTFLHVAIQNKAVSVVRHACRRPEFAPILNIQDKSGNTALHLAVDSQNLRILCHLLKNREVLLNLRNREGETALDIARRKIRKGFFFGWNPDYLIYNTLLLVGAEFGCLLWDRLTAKSDSGRPTGLAEREERNTPAEELEKEESAKLADSTRTLGIGSVLIASVTFAAVITRVPGPGDSNYNNQQAGTSRLARSWHFEVFMVADALAFICASAATVGLMYSGMAMVTMRLRRRHFNNSLTLVTFSVMCLMAAFSLGVYMVLAPVARLTAILVSAICPLMVIYKLAEGLLLNIVLVSRAFCARRGFVPFLLYVAWFILLGILLMLLPVALFMLAWAESKYGYKIRRI